MPERSRVGGLELRKVVGQPVLGAAEQARSERRVQALQIVQFKLDKLEQHLQVSSRLLNDLRSLRRLLLDERSEPAAGHDSAA